MTDSKSVEELFTDIQLEHFLKAKGLNIGQYQTEYDCACGEKLYTDGHDHYKSNIHVVQASHISKKAMQLFDQELEKRVNEGKFEAYNKAKSYAQGFNQNVIEWIDSDIAALTTQPPKAQS